MIKVENTKVYGFEEAVRGVRNSWDSHEKADSFVCSPGKCEFEDCPKFSSMAAMGRCSYAGEFVIGENDLKLLSGLVKAGDSHAKALRMVTVWFDLTAPIYFWKHFDTYKHVVKCSESVMHTITSKPLTRDDFSMDHYDKGNNVAEFVIQMLCNYIVAYQDAKAENNTEQMAHWWNRLIELLPQSFNQKATICTNYQTLRNMYLQRKGHKLSEWQEFRAWVETLPYAKELICCE